MEMVGFQTYQIPLTGTVMANGKPVTEPHLILVVEDLRNMKLLTEIIQELVAQNNLGSLAETPKFNTERYRRPIKDPKNPNAAR